MPVDSSKMQRFLRGAVACLLTANGFAIAVIAGGDGVSSAQPAAHAPAHTVTLVTGKDGTRYIADRSTPQGRQAI